MCNCEQVVVLDNEGSRLKRLLGVLIFIDIVIVLAKLVFLRVNSLVALVSLVLLVVTYLSCHYIIASILMFVLMYECGIIAFFLLYRVQNSLNDIHDKFLIEGFYISIVVIEVIAITFSVLKIIVTFEAYQNFKRTYLQSINYGEVPQVEDGNTNTNTNKGEAKMSIAGFTPF